MTEPIKIPINVTAGNLQGLETVKDRVRELRKLGHMEFTQGMQQLIQEVRHAKGVAATAAAHPIEPGVSSRTRYYGPGFGPRSMRGYEGPGDRFYGPGFGPGSMAGYPSAAAAGRPTRRAFYGPGFGPGSMAGYASAAAAGRPTRGAFYGPGFGPGSMAGYPSAAAAGRPTGGAFYGPGFPLAAVPGRPTHGAFYGPGFAPGSMAGYPSAAAAGRPTRGAFYGPGFGPGSMAGYASAAAAGRSTGGAFYGPGFPLAAVPGRPTHGAFYGPGFAPGSMAGYASAAAAGRTARGAFYGPGFAPGSMAGYASAAAAGRPTGGAFYGPGFAPGSMAGYASAAAAGRPTGGAAYGPAYASAAAAGRPTYGAAYGPGGVVPPPRPGWAERFGMGIENTVAFGARGVLGGLGIAGRGLGAAYGAVHGPARAAMGAVAGIGIYQVMTQSMQLYEQRAKAVIDLGMRQGREFDAIGESIDTLRGKYHVLAQDSIAAIGVMSRVAGPAATRAWLEPSVAHGVAVGLTAPEVARGLAVGLTAPESAEISGRLSRFTTGREPMGQILSAARRSYGSRDLDQRMEPASQLEEASRMAAMHGAQGITAPAGLYGGLVGFFGRMGEQYMAPGEATGAYARMSAGLAPSGNPAIEAQRFIAVDELRRRREARGQGSIIRRGKDTFDLSTHTGKLAYLEQAGQDPELMEALRQRALTLAEGNPEHEKLLGQQVVFGGKLSMLETMRQMREAQAVGGFQNLPKLGAGGVDAQQGEVEAALAAREKRPEFAHAIRQAVAEAHLEKLGEPIVKAADQLAMALTRVADGLGENGLAGGMSELKAAIASLDTPTKQIASALIMLGSQSWMGVAVGATVGAGSFDDMLNKWLRSYNSPLTNDLATFNEWLTRITSNPRQPTTPSK